MKKAKRILALIGVILLLGLYLTTLISAIFTTSATWKFFKLSLLATLVIPLVLYVYLLIWRLIKGDEEEKDEED